MGESYKSIDQLRARLIVFREYLADGADAMLATRFFTLPQENDLFVRAVNSIMAFGGSGGCKDGLEALACAMSSEWTTDRDAWRRQVIVIWTDSGTHRIGHRAAAPNYPAAAMPRTFTELSALWANLPNQSGALTDLFSERLVLYAPEEPYWTTIFTNWANVVHFPSVASCGLGEMQYHEILNAIINLD